MVKRGSSTQPVHELFDTCGGAPRNSTSPSCRPFGPSRLNEVPAVAVEVLEHGNATVDLMARRLEESHAGRAHPGVVGGEVVSLQEQEDAPATLISDARLLLGAA